MDKVTDLILGVPTDSAKVALLAFYVPSFATKLFAGKAQMSPMWRALPDWFWVPCGVWEAIATALVYSGNMKYGLPLM
jgi:hypothetical protein